jgi:hypothetical protein
MLKAWGVRAVLSGYVLLLAVMAQAQTNAVVAGTVKDATGGVLPGVTVEVSSPALIESVRSTMTDETGQYKILELVPGTYQVTFMLTGFATVKREGIELTTGFTANVNAELRVGSVEETVTVSGSSPIVDIQNVRQQVVFSRATVDTLPTGKWFQDLGILVPGMTGQSASTGPGVDVGGESGQSYMTLAIHGGRGTDMEVQLEGMNASSWNLLATTIIVVTHGNYQEYAMDAAGKSAESETGGVRMNLITKEGGNAFQGVFSADDASELLSGKVSQNLIDRGLPPNGSNRNKALWNVNLSGGGRIRRNRLWFFSSYTQLRSDNYVGGLFYDKDPAAMTFLPDPGRQAYTDFWARDASTRLTWQASPRNKIGLYFDYNQQCNCHFGASPTRAPEAAQIAHNVLYPSFVTWTAPVTSHFLLEAGASNIPQDKYFDPEPEVVAAQLTEQNGGLSYRSNAQYRHEIFQNRTIRASGSYVTHGHTAKVGFSAVFGSVDNKGSYNPYGNVAYRVLNGIPNQVTYYGAAPQKDYLRPNMGVYGQDQWSTKRLTLNAGLRFDLLRYGYPAYDVPPSLYVRTARTGPGDVPLNWKSLSPRLGASYDLFGDGKTAVKWSLGKYVAADGIIRRSTINPLAQNSNTTRTWTPSAAELALIAAGATNVTPLGDPLNPAANVELGPSTNGKFGQAVVSTNFDPEWAKGFGKRPYNWELQTSVQHELLPSIGISAGYFRRWYGNFEVTNNLATSAADYDSFCITTPVDGRLPGGGGQQICGLLDLNPLKVGQINNVITSARLYGDRTENWNGFDISVNARPAGKGLLLQGGIGTGKTSTDSCGLAAALPQINVSGSTVTPMSYCRNDTPFLTQVKLFGSYKLPWDIQVAGTLQNIPGPPIAANYVATSAQVAQSLGRGLSSSSNVTVNIVPPNSLYGDRMNLLDLRAGKAFKVSRVLLRASLDLYNALNGNAVLMLNNTYGTNGASWLVPQSVVPPRLAKFSIDVNF